jgi:predicted membrane protein
MEGGVKMDFILHHFAQLLIILLIITVCLRLSRFRGQVVTLWSIVALIFIICLIVKFWIISLIYAGLIISVLLIVLFDAYSRKSAAKKNTEKDSVDPPKHFDTRA